LPEKVEHINTRLADLKATRASLDVKKLNADFREFYGKMLSGTVVDGMALAIHSGLIATRSLPLEVIAALESKAQGELAEVRTNSKTLAKKLGKKANI
jgi:hypothetical protein